MEGKRDEQHISRALQVGLWYMVVAQQVEGIQ